MEENQPPKKVNWADPYRDDYAYVNKYSKSATPSLVWAIVLFLLLTAFAVWRWKEIGDWEQAGGTLKMHSLEILLYKTGGRWCGPVVFFLLAVVCLVSGIRTWKRRKQMQEEADKTIHQ